MTNDKVEVSSLEPGQSFTYNRKPYIVSAVYPFGVMVVPPEPTPKRKLVEKLAPDTLVKPTSEAEPEPEQEPEQEPEAEGEAEPEAEAEEPAESEEPKEPEEPVEDTQ